MQLVRFHRQQGRLGAGVTLCAMLVLGAPSQGSAQQPVPGASQPPPSPSSAAAPAAVPYRPPIIALVQPADGATLPQDKPVVVFRFAQGEPNDPIDLASFTVAVDGHDRTRLFQVTAVEAWGPLGAPPIAHNDFGLAAGVHHLNARICSARGACGLTTASLTVVPNPAESQPASPPAAAGPAADGSGSSGSSRPPARHRRGPGSAAKAP